MPNFTYTAIESSSGRKRRGSVASASRSLATAELKAMGLVPTSLREGNSSHSAQEAAGTTSESGPGPEAGSAFVRPKFSLGIRKDVSRQGLTRFTRQLATLLKAGMPLLRALEVLARPERNPAFKEVLVELARVIRAGGNLSDGVKRFPRIFDSLYVAMTRAGEAGGALDVILDRLARFLERTERIKGRVKAAMTYPLIIMLVAVTILAGLMAFVVPKFQQIFNGVLKGQPLPPLTRGVIGSANFVHHHLVVAVGLIVLAGWVGRLVLRTQRGRRVWDGLCIRVPVAGDLLLKAATARFTRTFGSLLASGVPILEALMITRAASGNVHIAEALLVIHDRVKAGGAVSRALESVGTFPSLVASLIEVGEETGALPEMLGRIADTYDEEVDNAVSALTTIIEPVMIVLMALVVGIIVIALFLPIVGIVQHLQ